MKVRQYVYLSVLSHDLVPEQIDRELGLTADEAYARGSKRAEPRAVPPYHVWRMRPAQQAIQSFSRTPARDVSIQVVRDFEPGPEDEAILAARATQLPPDLEILRGQHPLLGLDLSAEDLAWLARLGVSVSFDEYADEYE